MTDNSARQPKGVPVGGQFAATTHAEPAMNLTPRRPELAGWPESLPEPEVEISFGDDNVVTTSVSINGECLTEAWNPGDDVHSTESNSFENDLTQDEDINEAVEIWTRKKHNEIADAIRVETYAAVTRSKAGILAAATGKTKQLSDQELGELVGLNQSAAYAARRDAEYAATAVIARGVLKEHPTASHIGLRVDSADNGEFVSGAVVYDAEFNKLGYYDADAQYMQDAFDEDSGSYQGEGFVEHLGSLEAEPGKSWWSEYNMPGIDPDDAYTINLAKAAAWTPAVSR